MAHSRVRIFVIRMRAVPHVCLLILETRLVAAVAADLVGIGVDGEAAGLQEVVILVPDQNVSGLDANLLQPLGNRHHQRMVGANAFAAQAVDLEANDLAFGNKIRGHNPLPCFGRVLAACVSCDGAVEQSGTRFSSGCALVP